MANITESPTYDAAVPQLETNTPATGGAGGAMNSQAQALANRTAYFKAERDKESVAGRALVEAANAAAQRTLLNVVTVAEFPAASTTQQGVALLAVNGGVTAGTVVQGNDSRLPTTGSWTPVIGGDSESGQTYIVQSGSWVKIGPIYHLFYRIKLSAKGTITGTLAKLKGFPVTGASGGGGGYTLGCGGVVQFYVAYANFALGSRGGTSDFLVSHITDSTELAGVITIKV